MGFWENRKNIQKKSLTIRVPKKRDKQILGKWIWKNINKVREEITTQKMISQDGLEKGLSYC